MINNIFISAIANIDYYPKNKEILNNIYMKDLDRLFVLKLILEVFFVLKRKIACVSLDHAI